MPDMPKNVYDALEHPKTCAPDDFWGQVRRTVNGKPVPQEQIDMIFAMVRDALRFEREDALLDLCCGNGALGSAFFGEIGEYLGVDMSPYLIEIAEENFSTPPARTFVHMKVQDYCLREPDPSRFTKILIYGAFPYFSLKEAHALLHCLRKRFTEVRRLFIGTIPDIACADAFFQGRERPSLEDSTTAIGRWYARQEFLDLSSTAGWQARIVESPAGYYQAHYRYNALLTAQE